MPWSFLARRSKNHGPSAVWGDQWFIPNGSEQIGKQLPVENP
jgi:hypothetical protein